MDFLTQLQQYARWPSREEIFAPRGGGPAVYCELARKKIEIPINREFHSDIRVGVIVADSDADSSDMPLGIICENSVALSPIALQKIRNLAWNFCRAHTLLVIEPQSVKVWSCFEPPNAQGKFEDDFILGLDSETHLPADFIAELQWLNFASGLFFQQHASSFCNEKRADFQLLSNLKIVRNHLLGNIKANLLVFIEGNLFKFVKENPSDFSDDALCELPKNELLDFIKTELLEKKSIGVAHDLLARIIFIQFLFDRKDSSGKAALDESVLCRLHKEGLLEKNHDSLKSILRYKPDVFSLFTWLNKIANGDLFTDDYSLEQEIISQENLNFLADFISGNLEMDSGQLYLWPQYSFDTIPLEFVSSIYEEFVTGFKLGTTGEHYTRPFLVDFLLDKVLPWSGAEYDLKILDPCCGSAVFLVKAFQRLVYRWKQHHKNIPIPISVLRNLLENNLWGCDTNENAIRVASFSLYLALCDEIDPKEYLSSLQFPKLRDKTLLCIDFFLADDLFNDLGLFDLIIGNAPWGKNTITDAAHDWAKTHKWSVEYNQIGGLFLPKAASLCKETGSICMIQSEATLLSNGSKKALAFRRKLFSRYKVFEIINLALLRHSNLFPNAISPCCIIKMSPTVPDNSPMAYWFAKRIEASAKDIQRIVLNLYDLNWVWSDEAATDPDIWYCLSIGGRSDYNLIKRIKRRFVPISSYIKNSILVSQTGMFRGKYLSEYPETYHIPVFDKTTSWNELPDVVVADNLELNENPCWGEDAKRRTELFDLPLLLTKETWSAITGHLKSVWVKPGKRYSKIVYTKQHICLKAATPEYDIILELIAKLINSKFASYFLFATCGRLVTYIPTICKEDLLSLPLPRVEEILKLKFSLSDSKEEIDNKFNEVYGFSSVEAALVDDFFDSFLPKKSATLNRTHKEKLDWNSKGRSAILEEYIRWVIDEIDAFYGETKEINASVFTHAGMTKDSLLIVAFHFSGDKNNSIRYVNTSQPHDILESFNKTDKSEIAYRRVALVYGSYDSTPTVFLIKPNQIDFWRRSIALRDAEMIIGDFLSCGMGEKK